VLTTGGANQDGGRWIGCVESVGTPVFRGTRLPVQTLFDYLSDGLTLDYFLETFEGITRDDARAVLRHG
jgi:uncharacterized protein (DUF433 family)